MEEGERTKSFDGYLISKLHAIGTRSEGPQYFLQRWDYREERVIKAVSKSERDPTLQRFLGQKVTIHGERNNDGIRYHRIAPIYVDRILQNERISGLALSMSLESKVLVVEQQLAQFTDGKLFQHFDLTLVVEWPERSGWRGMCPTTQLYDFSIWFGGEELWRWSTMRRFADVVSPVYLSGRSRNEYSVTWHFSPHDLREAGTYIARGTFIASGESVEEPFEVSISRR